MADIRIKDLDAVTDLTAADKVAIDGASGTRRIAVEDFFSDPIAFAALQYPTMLGGSVAVDFNAANTDHAIAITLPSGVTKYRLQNIIVENTGDTASLTTARGGLFGAAAGGSPTLIADQALSAITSNTVNVAANFLNLGAVAAAVNFTTLYWRTSTAQGAAATGKVYIIIQPLP